VTHKNPRPVDVAVLAHANRGAIAHCEIEAGKWCGYRHYG
jgi:hypothetical protein